jgi:hypothetical protein
MDNCRVSMCFVEIGSATITSFTIVNMCSTQYPYFLTHLVKFGIEELHEKPLIQFEFRKNRCSEKAILSLVVASKNISPQLFFFCGAATRRGSWPPHS